MLYRGDRVEMTERGIESGLDGDDNALYKRSTTGVVVREQHNNLITVKRDGRITPCRYHVNFWKLAEPLAEDYQI